MKGYQWKFLKRKERALWLLGLRAYHPEFGLVRSLFWQPLAAGVDQQYRTRIASMATKHREEIATLQHSMAPVVEKLTRITLQRPGFQSNLFRLILDLDPFMIRDAFQFGNDDNMMRHFSEQIGMMAYRELKTVNMHRFSDPRFGS